MFAYASSASFESCLTSVCFVSSCADPVSQLQRANGISDSNAKALEAAVTKIMSDYWQAHNCNGSFLGSDPDLYAR